MLTSFILFIVAVLLGMATSGIAFSFFPKKKRIFQDIYFSIEDVSGIGIIYTKTGEYSAIIKMDNPIEKFSADINSYYDASHLFNTISLALGEGYAIHKQDIFSRQKFSYKQSQKLGYLSLSYFKHFLGRPYTSSLTYLTITYSKAKSKFFSFDEKTWDDFLLKIYKVEILKEIDDEIKDGKKERDSSKDTIDYNEIKKEIIAQFLSVSYPLKQIVVTSSFGPRRDPFSKKQKSHNGIDLKAKNEEVYSMMEGEIIKTASDKASGNYLMIKHKDYIISYCHLSMALVSKGQKVKAGDVVAISGNSGRSTGPHLHITCRYKGKYQDPSILLDYIGLVRKDAKERLEVAISLAEK